MAKVQNINPKTEELKALIKEFPQTPGVYLMKNARDKIIYVGKAKKLKNRVRSYFNSDKNKSVKTIHLVNKIDKIDYVLTDTEVEAFLLEASLIKKHRPRYNIRLKDDKSYPYIKCTAHEDFPRFYLARKVKVDGSLYFGPYTSGYTVRESIRFMNRVFQIRDCSNSFMKARKRACMTHQIERCTAPCVDLITKEDYKKDVEGALNFLRGTDKKVVKNLNQKMKQAASEERFEAAAQLRDSISAIESIWEKQSVISTEQENDQDVIAFYGDHRGTLIETMHIRRGRVIGSRHNFFNKLDASSESEDPKEWLTSFLNQYYTENIVPDEMILPVDLGTDLYKLLNAVFDQFQKKNCKFVYALDKPQQALLKLAQKNAQSHFEDQVSKQDNIMEALEEIQVKLRLPELPTRIECYDISNFQGDQSVASQVVFEDGVEKKSEYRRYKIKTVEGSNDFDSMKEVLGRRLKHTEYDDPQLIVVDGGKGQLSSAVRILKELGRTDIPIVGMAKARTQGEFTDQEIKGSEERFFLPGRSNPIKFRKNAMALNILVQVRDEAHRFAITYHRKLRDKFTMKSALDDVSGLGPKRKIQLIKKFGDISGIREASLDDIAGLRGFNLHLAKKIHEALGV